MRKLGRIIFVVFTFIPIMLQDGLKKTLNDAKKFIKTNFE